MGLDQKWIDTVDDGLTNSAWDGYDNTIKAEVDSYNKRFASTSGYKAVDWTFCKAMVWAESGGPKSPSWKKRVMQIGNSHDPGYRVLKAGREGAFLIMSPQLAADIKAKSINNPKLNIQAGIAYLFDRLAKFVIKSIEDSADSKEHDYTVVSGDSLEAISKKVGTTVEILQTMNSGASGTIHPKQVLKYRKGSMKTVIDGWREFSSVNAAKFYNGGGDPNYAAKLDYVLDLFKKLKR